MEIRNIHMPEGDLCDLYILIRNFRSVYCQNDRIRYHDLGRLMDEVNEIYTKEYPKRPCILKNRNTRFAGRKKTYDAVFEDEVLKLYSMGKGPTEIAKEKGCSKSYVSKLIRKQLS